MAQNFYHFFLSIVSQFAIGWAPINMSHRFMLRWVGIILGIWGALSACSAPVEGDLLAAANVGRSCTAGDHSSTDFGGFTDQELSYGSSSFEICGLGGCLVEKFQGRSDCPAGNLNGQQCTTSRGEIVTVPVRPQLDSQSAEDRSYCSCRCAGNPQEQPLCACPTGFSCSVDFTDGSNTGFSVCARNRTEAIAN